MKALIASFAVLSSVSACTSTGELLGPVPYRTEFNVLGNLHGTRAKLIEGNRYRITTTINQMTDPVVMPDYNMLKSAELAREKGYKYFIVEIDEGSMVNISKMGMRGQPREYDREVARTYSAEIEISLTNEPIASGKAVDAEAVLATLGPKYIEGFEPANTKAGDK